MLMEGMIDNLKKSHQAALEASGDLLNLYEMENDEQYFLHATLMEEIAKKYRELIQYHMLIDKYANQNILMWGNGQANEAA